MPTPAPIFVPRSAPTTMRLNAPEVANYASEKTRYEASAEYNVDWFQISNPSIRGTDTHLSRINAAAAYARGATGAGETIAIVDTGIRDTHREFSGTGKVTKVTQGGYPPTDRQKFHGTYVAALAVGNRDSGPGLNMHGVAFDASVHFTEISLGTSDGIYRPFRLENYNNLDDRSDAMDYSNIIKTAKDDAGAVIINASFGHNGAISSYDQREVRSRLEHTAQALAQATVVDADKTIIVWAAGNAGSLSFLNGDPAPFDSPEILQGLGAYFPELQSHVLAVVALDQDGSIADYSNRCGIAKSFCLAAPGSGIVSALNSADEAYGAGIPEHSGTSFAAPIVSGSLALLRQYFRGQLGNTELVTRLLATANRGGIYAVSNTYGHGLVDLDAATAPVGAIMTGLPGDPNSRSFASSAITLSGGAFGASLQDTLANVEVAGFDALGAPFFQSAATWVRRPQERRGIERETRKLSLSTSYHGGQNPIQNRGAGLSLTTEGSAITDARLAFTDGWWVAYGQHGGQSLGLYEQSFANPLVGGQGNNWADRFNDPLAFAAPYLSLVRDGAGIGWSSAGSRFGFALMHGAPQFDRQQKAGGKRGVGMLLNMSMKRLPGAGLSLQVGAVSEADGFLGARTQGAFGKASAATTFVGINGAWVGNDNWHVLASAYLGHTRPQIDGDSLLRDVSTIVSSAFSIGIARASIWRADDWLGLRLSQPLRAESGEARLRVASGRTKYGEVLYQNHTVSLVPTGRAVHAAAIYRLPIGGGALETRIGIARHAQHHSAHDLRPFMRLAFERRF